MFGERVLLPHLLTAFLGHLTAEGLHEVMHRGAALDELLDVIVEAVVGGVHVAEEGVATDWRDLDAVEHRSHGGSRPPCDVVVPEVLVATGLGRLLEADELGPARVGRDERMDLERTEA